MTQGSLENLNRVENMDYRVKLKNMQIKDMQESRLRAHSNLSVNDS